jgi:hyperosmotically inducible periplasmic protein
VSYRAPNWLLATISCLVLLAPSAQSQQQQQGMTDAQQQATLRIAKAVRKDILSLPQYGVFDNIHFAIQNADTVILKGEASRPVLKSSIENVVKKIEGVKTVKNEIEVLPTSPMDDGIRARVYAAIYGYAPLQKYTSNRGGAARLPTMRVVGGITNDPPIGYHAIHIIVKNGNVTLTGVVDSETDMTMAGMRANMVSGVFSVDNDLQVAGKPVQAAK